MSDPKSVRSGPNGHQPGELTAAPNPEVAPRPCRRTFTAEYKLRIVAEADACDKRSGEIGALLRREGLYHSHLEKWRRLRREGSLQSLASRKRGPKSDPQAAEIAQLRRENERLQARLKQAEAILEVQKKLSALLGLTENDEQS
jgi:transposase